MTNVICTAFLLVFILVPQILPAQPPGTLNIRETIRMALRQNLTLKQTGNAVTTSQINVREARSTFLPYISLSATGSKEYITKQRSLIPGQYYNPGGEAVSATVSANLNLFSGFGNIGSLQQANRSFAAQQATYSFDAQSLMYQVISQYLQVVQNLDLINIAKENLKAQQQQLVQIQEFRKRGNRTVADVLQQEATVKQSQLQVLTATQTYQSSRYTLLQSLGEAPSSDYQFEPLQIERISSLLDTRDVQVQMDSVLHTRQDIRSQELQTDAAHYQIRVAQAGFWPTVSLFANGSTNYNSTEKFASFSDQFRYNRVGSIGLSLSLPIFDQLTTLHNVERAKIQLSDQQLILQNLKLNAKVAFTQAMLDYRSAVEQLEVARSQYQYAQEALKVVQAQYKAGVTTFVQLMLSQAQALSSQYDLVNAQYNKLIKFFEVRFQRGDIEEAISFLDYPAQQ
ncbi:MAG: TolC family protein [Calditrichia bacterium]